MPVTTVPTILKQSAITSNISVPPFGVQPYPPPYVRLYYTINKIKSQWFILLAIFYLGELLLTIGDDTIFRR
jgi:hypothetical protein